MEAKRDTFLLPVHVNQARAVNSTHDPFRTLVITLISQNTTNVNTRRAFENLCQKFPIAPKPLAKASVEEIEDCLRVGGLYRTESKVLKDVSHILLQRYDGSLDFIYSLPMKEARKTLVDLPGVGPKTADVILFCFVPQNQPCQSIPTCLGSRRDSD